MEGNARPCGAGVDLGAYAHCMVDFVRGNSDAQGAINVSVAIFALAFLFVGGTPPPCLDAADANDDGDLDISDGVRVLVFLFAGEAPPPSPFPDCGTDETEDAMDCVSFAGCE